MAIGRALILAGLALVLIGLVFTLGDKLPFRPGRLPGDIVVKGKNSVFYFPIVTSILLSALLTAILWLFGRR